jgi:hypothetical protein
VGIRGVGIMNLTAFSLLANNNPEVDGNQISFGTIDFQPHPPTLTLVFTRPDQEMELTIGSLNFRVGSLVSIRLSDLTKSNSSARKSATVAISESSGGPSSEVNSPVSFAMTENSEGKIKELNETMGNLGLGGIVDQSYLSQKDFTTRSGGVYSNIHQLCVIITEATEENDGTDNAATHEQGDKSRSNIKKEKEKIHVSTGEWKIIMSAINHGTEVLANSKREVLMGYQYRTKRRILCKKHQKQH